MTGWRERFWSRVARRGPDECWLWQGGVSSAGYGQFDKHGRKVGAHVVAYEALHGTLPRGRVVRHKCDTPLCCNPAHLISGTHKDNADDRDKRGRYVPLHGDANGRTTVNRATVIAIFLAVKQGHSQAAVARAYQVKPSLVYDIVHRRAHARVTEGL